ncbi:receptor-like protein kinase [Heracleum sosnowskyi]|uniref:Receptor-like protein kinase n=1 Tax=Heracleum sosnowskyi TaxID=360622 RepID=A0AAD8NDL5_9APIA|nr:receptor-like protein kinase [Heracleum sosnowskyi]
MKQKKSNSDDILSLLLMCIAAFAIFVKVSNADELLESKNVITFSTAALDNRKALNIEKVYRRALLQNIGNREAVDASSPDNNSAHQDQRTSNWKFIKRIPIVLGLAFFFLLAYIGNRKAVQTTKDKEILKILTQSPPPPSFPPMKDVEEVKQVEEKPTDLNFFVEEEERFKMSDLLEAQANLQGHGLCSSLYKVTLKNNAILAVKRLKQSPVSFDEYSAIMRKIGKLRHPNILPLVGYGFTVEARLLIYKFQHKGSLLALLERYTEGKKDFPWTSRLSIAVGIARGLNYIYQRGEDEQVIPHGNIKLSNILLDDDEMPLISEHGCSKLMDPKKSCLLNANGHTAPEKTFSEQSDVFSFGVILLELLTGKIVEKSGLDLPKWVRAMVREEWTGEVFDKEIAKIAKHAFPLLNISLKCVAHLPQDRPTIAEVLEKIEEVANVHDDLSPASTTSIESNPSCLLHSVVPEEWETPRSIQ